jgi:hypothetical protein
MEAADISDMLINFYQTTLRNNTEGSHIHTHQRENLKSQSEKPDTYSGKYSQDLEQNVYSVSVLEQIKFLEG